MNEREQQEYDSCMKEVRKWLSYGPISSWQLCDMLRDKFSERLVGKCLEWLVENETVNEETVTEYWMDEPEEKDE